MAAASSAAARAPADCEPRAERPLSDWHLILPVPNLSAMPRLTGGAFLSGQTLDYVEHGGRVVAALPFLRYNSVDATDLHLSRICPSGRRDDHPDRAFRFR